MAEHLQQRYSTGSGLGPAFVLLIDVLPSRDEKFLFFESTQGPVQLSLISVERDNDKC